MKLEGLGWDETLKRWFARHGREGLSPGRIAAEEKGLYRVFSAGAPRGARVSGRFRHEAREAADFPVVGDWVAWSPPVGEGEGTIRAVLPRRGAYSRKVAGETTREQILAANVDAVFIVAGLDGDFNVRRIERMLTPAYDSGALPVILLNKSDLTDDAPEKVEFVSLSAPGVVVHALSAKEATGLEVFSEYLGPGMTAVLVGSSGVGKSTLINALFRDPVQKVGAVREDDSRGRHTTTRRELLILPGGGMIIDTPGIREVQLWSEGEGLEAGFSDIGDLARECRFRDCTHADEPGCAVRTAVEIGTLDRGRFGNYLKMKRELAHLSARRDRSAAVNVKRKWKKISVWSRKIKKSRERGE